LKFQYELRRNNLYPFGSSDLRILQIHNFYQWAGGEDVVVENERLILEHAGHEVELYAVSNATIFGLSAKVRTFLNAKYNETARIDLLCYLNNFRPDIVHVHNFFPLLTPSIYDACAELGIPIVQTLHNYRLFCAGGTLFRDGKPCELCLDGRSYRAVIHKCYRGSLPGSFATANMIHYYRRNETWSKVARFIVFISFARDKFIEAGFPPERIVVKPNFTADPGIPDYSQRRGALFVGRLSPEKGVSALLKAWTKIDYPLRIIGAGPDEAILRTQAPPTVTFQGQVPPDGVRAAMRSARLIIMPSLWYEGLPMTLMEAFANGLPVVASDLGAFAEVVEDSVTGRLFPPGDSTTLAAVVNRLLSEPERLIRMSMAARARYESTYTAQQNLSQLLSVYHDALKDPPPSA
jgi:glycosyltransferase involved in cell wall biosynthesis